MEWPTGSGGILDLCHVVDAEAQSSKIADVVLRAMRSHGERSSRRHPDILTVEHERREKAGTLGHRGTRRRRYLLTDRLGHRRGRRVPILI
jgi:hypothetical protein